MAKTYKLSKDGHEVTTTVASEVVNLKASGYSEVVTPKTKPKAKPKAEQVAPEATAPVAEENN